MPSEEGELLLSDLVISAADGSIPKGMTTKVSEVIAIGGSKKTHAVLML